MSGPTETKNQLDQLRIDIAVGDRHIARQQEVIANLERANQDAQAAYRMLTVLEEAQAQRLADRNRIARRLANQRRF